MSRSSSVRAAFLAAVLFAAGCQPHGPEALRRGDWIEAARVADEINKKNREIRKLLQEAKRE